METAVLHSRLLLLCSGKLTLQFHGFEDVLIDRANGIESHKIKTIGHQSIFFVDCLVIQKNLVLRHIDIA